MTIILTSFGSYGDVLPFLWMAKTLKYAGHNPILITNTVFKETVEAAGISFYGIGTEKEYNSLFSSIDVTNSSKNPFVLLRNMKSFIQGMIFAPIEETIRIIDELYSGDTVVIHSMLAFGGAIAARKLGIRNITAALSPTNIASFGDSSPLRKKIEAMSFEMIYGKHLKKVVKRLNIDIPQPGKHGWLFEYGTLCTFPGWFIDFSLKDSNKVTFTGFPEIESENLVPESFGEFIKKNPDPVIFTPGTPFRNNGLFFSEALETLKMLGKPGIFLTRNPSSIPKNLPENIYVSDFLPLEKMLHHCSLIVHHGGIGTTAQALRSAVPQIIYYHPGLDQEKNAAIATSSGVALSAVYRKLSAEKTAQYAVELLSQPVKEDCLKLQRRMAEQSSSNELLRLLDLN